MRTGRITQAGPGPPRSVYAIERSRRGAYRCQTCQLRHNNIPWGIHEQLSCSERGRCTLSQVQDSLVHSPDNQKEVRGVRGEALTAISRICAACCQSPEISLDQDKRVLTTMVLPFVYTIFSLLALSLVYTPLTVVGLAEYNATFVKDIVFVRRVAIDITKLQYYHKTTIKTLSHSIAIPISIITQSPVACLDNS